MLTQPLLGGFEPSVEVDQFNNIYVAAHKDRHINAVTPDPLCADVRASSWVWTSSDGVSFHCITPNQTYALQFGDEGDLALDNANHLYFVDTSATDSSFTRWAIAGPGQQTMEATRPAIPTAQPVDDRPWVAARGDNVVLYMANEGVATGNPGITNAGPGSGPGRYDVYMSHDGGTTFPVQGVTLRDSGWCRPAGDPRPAHTVWEVVCIDINNPDQVYTQSIYSYVSPDDGLTWYRYTIGHWSSADWPSVQFAADGTIYTSLADRVTNPNGSTTNLIRVFRSTDVGQTWQENDVPWSGDQVPYSWLAVAPDGTLGVGFYSRPDTSSTWNVYAAETQWGQPWVIGKANSQPLASSSGFPKGDFFQVAFGPDNRLSVVWTADSTSPLQTTGDDHDVFYARQTEALSSPGSGVPESPWAPALVCGGLVAAAALTLHLRRRPRAL